MMAKHKRALVLNADYSAIGLMGWQSAIKLNFKGIAHMVDFYKNDFVLASNGDRWPSPAVIALKKYEKCKKKVPYSRKYIYIRDRLTCQYCNERFHYSDLTLDHVVPRSKYVKGKTPTHWENIVSCCHKCNTKKSDYELKDTDMKLIKTPCAPLVHNIVLGLSPWSILRKEWEPYVPKYYLELLETE